MSIINLPDLGDGAVGERIALEINRVLANIADPNTEASFKRELTLTLVFAPDAERDVIRTKIKAKTKLAPARDIETKLILDVDNDGQVIGAELKSGVKNQLMINDAGKVADHVGKELTELPQQTSNDKVVGFNRYQN